MSQPAAGRGGNRNCIVFHIIKLVSRNYGVEEEYDNRILAKEEETKKRCYFPKKVVIYRFVVILFKGNCI